MPINLSIIIFCCFLVIIIYKLSYYINTTVNDKFQYTLIKYNYNINTEIKNNVILFYSYDYKEVPKFTEYSFKIIKEYCDLHNYSLLQLNHYPNISLSPYWLRVKDLINLSEIYDNNTIFVYLDLDTILNPKYINIKIEYLINSIDKIDNTKYNLYVSKDRMYGSTNGYGIQNINNMLDINTGFIIVRNTNYSKQFLKYWYNLYPENNWKHINNKWLCFNNQSKNNKCQFADYSYEQGSFNHIYANNLYNSQANIKLLDWNIASINNINYDSFIYHFYGIDKNDIYNLNKSLYHSYYDNKLLSLLHPTNQLPLLENYNTIPNILFQTYYNKSIIPKYIFDAVNHYASNYQHVVFDDKDAIQFLEKYFDQRVVHRFHDLKLGPHKADLLRYCYLYVYGGIYLDIKTILINPLDDIFKDKECFYTCIDITSNAMHNAIIASKARNIIFLRLINHILDSYNIQIKYDYLIFCKKLYTVIYNDLIYQINIGKNIGESQNYYLFQEICNTKTDSKCLKLDKYGLCCSIYDIENQKIFIGRDPNFPW